MILGKISRVELHGRKISEHLVEALLHHVVEGLDVVGRGQG